MVVCFQMQFFRTKQGGFLFDCFIRVICKILTVQIEYYMIALLELFVIFITNDDCPPES